MYDHILLPIDFGGPADMNKACATARGMLSDGGKITLLHVIEPIPTYAAPYIPPEIETNSFQKAKEKLADKAAELGLKDTAVLNGSVGRSIVIWAEENNADCIVVPSHQPVMSDIILGSTAAWVVRHARCSVLVLR